MSDEKKTKSSSILTIVIYAVFVLASAGGGYFYSGMAAPPAEQQAAGEVPEAKAKMAEKDEAKTKDKKGKGKGKEGAKDADYENVEAELAYYKWTDLPPLTTNIGEPSNVWARLELSLATKGTVPEDVASGLAEDILMYLRTVKLAHVSKPSGFRYFLDDMREIAAVKVGPDFVEIFPTAVIFE
ncbi:MAG: hypothetical protein AAFY99_13110 [Pseudomonadota bacterium]